MGLTAKQSGRLLIAFLVLSGITPAFAQNEVEPPQEKKEFKISLEFRPRTEYRNGYGQLMEDSSRAAFFTEGRSRLLFNFKMKNFIFHTSIQDIRVWGEKDPRSTAGTIQVFEAYVEPTIVKNLSVRIGKQKIMYDNQRLFAQNDWRQAGGTHDAVRFMYKAGKLEADLIGAFNQEKARNAETDFSPDDFSNYKILAANFIKYKPLPKLTLTAINASDGFQDAVDIHKTHFRFTSGGRVEHTGENLYLTLAGYYQYGHTSEGKKLSAFYLQPEVKYQLPKYLTFRLGAEVFSGDDAMKPSGTSHSFDALYGVNHRFLGSMDYFTRFPKDFNNAGIIAPYFFTFLDLSKKLTFRTDEHLFFSENRFAVNEEEIDPYLGFEHDLLFIYKPNSYTDIQLGYSYLLATESMEIIKKGGNSELWTDWAFLMLTFKPELFKWENEKH